MNLERNWKWNKRLLALASPTGQGGGARKVDIAQSIWYKTALVQNLNQGGFYSEGSLADESRNFFDSAQIYLISHLLRQTLLRFILGERSLWKNRKLSISVSNAVRQ